MPRDSIDDRQYKFSTDGEDEHEPHAPQDMRNPHDVFPGKLKKKIEFRFMRLLKKEYWSSVS